MWQTLALVWMPLSQCFMVWMFKLCSNFAPDMTDAPNRYYFQAQMNLKSHKAECGFYLRRSK